MSWLRPRTLTGRLRLASCLLLPLMLGLTALVLDRAFDRSLRVAMEERLKLQTYVLLGAAEAGGGQLWMPPQLQEPRFGQPGSGLYGIVADGNDQVLWRSPSALGEPLSLPRADRRQQFGQSTQGLFFYSYRVTWETEDGRETPLRFVSIEQPATYLAERRGFRTLLWSGLGLLALLLLIAQGVLLRWGLRPLSGLAADIKAIESGEAEQLSGDYPREVAPVTENLNLLLAGEHRQRERYRNTLADLAHSLKTPLAVIRNIDPGRVEDLSALKEQVDRMDQIISHQLGRASTAANHQLLQAVSVRAAAERIGTALGKVYRDSHRNLRIIGDELHFRGDERDLMEVLGNLLDNAFKYGRGEVQVTLTETPTQQQILIEDNGLGIDDSLHQTILERGTRADSLPRGQGIGLAVVKDIVTSYNGELSIGSSAELGGAAFTLRFPRRAAVTN
ncbi:ATP-binding protein [Motiliproteus sediminis]|uniref:ATP-binding protein n=1 Tax=Motiliproteus sediminis TaxID=1468178 RepID=UPI001AEFCB2C|nr:ATP-binding protein [Motiliproteus sediminis]